MITDPLSLLKKHNLTAEVQSALEYIAFSAECAKDKLVTATAPDEVKRLQGRCHAYRLIYRQISGKQMPDR